ncbi:MAG: hypothetical protein ABJA16_08470 [Nakamurella sp.]
MQRFLRPAWVVGHVLVLIAMLVCFRLAWWQLARSEETDGTIQNVGYALLWPAFGVAFVYMWVKFIRLELERTAQDEQDHQELLESMLAEAESFTAEAAGVASVTASDGSDDGDAEVVAGTMEGSAPPDQLSGFNDVVGIVDDEDQDDAELIAYNRALAALAEKDRRAR